jgi:hypothetical protein
VYCAWECEPRYNGSTTSLTANTKHDKKIKNQTYLIKYYIQAGSGVLVDHFAFTGICKTPYLALEGAKYSNNDQSDKISMN